MSAASPGRRRELIRALAMTGFGIAAVLLEAAPAGVAALSLPSPDLLFCVVAVWAIRAPGAAPLVLVFALGLVRDLVTDVPPGLGALTLVGAAEALKARAGALRRQPFVVEWLWVALACAAMTALQWLGLLVSFAQPPYGMLLAQQVTVTAAVYPLFVLLVGRALSPRDRRGA